METEKRSGCIINVLRTGQSVMPFEDEYPAEEKHDMGQFLPLWWSFWHHKNVLKMNDSGERQGRFFSLGEPEPRTEGGKDAGAGTWW